MTPLHRIFILFKIFILFQLTFGRQLNRESWYLGSHLAYYDEAKFLCVSENEGQLATIKTEDDGYEIEEMLGGDLVSDFWVDAVLVQSPKCQIPQNFTPSCWIWSDGTAIVGDWDGSAYDHHQTSTSRVYYDVNAGSLLLDKNTGYRRYVCRFNPNAQLKKHLT